MATSAPGRVLLVTVVGTAVSLATAPAGAAQQTGTLRGTVSSAISERPLNAVNIAVEGTRLETRTDRDGRYEIAGIPVGVVSLRVELAPYTSVVEEIVIGPNRVTELDFSLRGMADVLDEIVAEGRTDRRRRTATRATEIAAESRAGVSIDRSSGQVGSGSRIQLRGVNSFILTNNPVIYIDGVRVSSSSRAIDPTGAIGPSILDLIPAEAIARIRVIRGPAASARFGMGSSNGVVLVYTKGGMWLRQPR